VKLSVFCDKDLKRLPQGTRGFHGKIAQGNPWVEGSGRECLLHTRFRGWSPIQDGAATAALCCPRSKAAGGGARAAQTCCRKCRNTVPVPVCRQSAPWISRLIVAWVLTTFDLRGFWPLDGGVLY